MSGFKELMFHNEQLRNDATDIWFGKREAAWVAMVTFMVNHIFFDISPRGSGPVEVSTTVARKALKYAVGEVMYDEGMKCIWRVVAGL